MFYLRKGGTAEDPNSSGKVDKEEEFGWWVGDREATEYLSSVLCKDTQSSGSSASMLSCIDWDDAESFALARDFSRHESGNGWEKIELTSFNREQIDVDLIERDAALKEMVVTSTATKSRDNENNADKSKSTLHRSEGACYTPERLIRSQEYRILTPSPRYLSISHARVIPHNDSSRRTHRCRRRLNYLIVDSKQVGASRLKALLDSDIPEILPSMPCEHHERPEENHDVARTCNKDNVPGHPLTEEIVPTTLHTSYAVSDRSSYEKLNITWEECKKSTHDSSLEDTSGIHSNEWSSDTPSEMLRTPLCLCDELAIASRNYRTDVQVNRELMERHVHVNNVASILDDLETDPEKAAVLLEDDRFCDSISSHDRLTRLALSIETDGNTSDDLGDSESTVRLLQGKVERLQIASQDIYGNICSLRKGFQNDEKRIMDLTSDATKLRQDIQEMRYFDDLLNLLRGELERISSRNWPFVLGHTECYNEELNLIV